LETLPDAFGIPRRIKLVAVPREQQLQSEIAEALGELGTGCGRSYRPDVRGHSAKASMMR
jgi:hypothetical protein